MWSTLNKIGYRTSNQNIVNQHSLSITLYYKFVIFIWQLLGSKGDRFCRSFVPSPKTSNPILAHPQNCCKLLINAIALMGTSFRVKVWEIDS